MHIFRKNETKPDGLGEYMYVGEVGDPLSRVEADDRLDPNFPDCNEDVAGYAIAGEHYPELVGEYDAEGELIAAATV